MRAKAEAEPHLVFCTWAAAPPTSNAKGVRCSYRRALDERRCCFAALHERNCKSPAPIAAAMREPWFLRRRVRGVRGFVNTRLSLQGDAPWGEAEAVQPRLRQQKSTPSAEALAVPSIRENRLKSIAACGVTECADALPAHRFRPQEAVGDVAFDTPTTALLAFLECELLSHLDSPDMHAPSTMVYIDTFFAEYEAWRKLSVHKSAPVFACSNSFGRALRRYTSVFSGSVDELGSRPALVETRPRSAAALGEPRSRCYLIVWRYLRFCVPVRYYSRKQLGAPCRIDVDADEAVDTESSRKVDSPQSDYPTPPIPEGKYAMVIYGWM